MDNKYYPLVHKPINRMKYKNMNNRIVVKMGGWLFASHVAWGDRIY